MMTNDGTSRVPENEDPFAEDPESMMAMHRDTIESENIKVTVCSPRGSNWRIAIEQTCLVAQVSAHISRNRRPPLLLASKRGLGTLRPQSSHWNAVLGKFL